MTHLSDQRRGLLVWPRIISKSSNLSKHASVLAGELCAAFGPLADFPVMRGDTGKLKNAC